MLFKRLFLTFLFLTTSSVLAFTPTAAQIEQFKKLPKAQQEALARQYGVDLSTITGKTTSEESLEVESTIQPRLEKEEEQLTDEERFAPKESEVEPFGYDIFAGEPTSFMPTENAAVPDTYLIGRGDELNINFYGKESESYDLTVDREGRINIPNLSPVQVAGLTFMEVKELIKAKVEQEVIGVKAFVSVGRLRSIRILVLGEAYKPGSYSVSSLATVSHALFVSGGVSDIASLRNIQIKRAGKVVANFDLYDLLINGDSSNDIILKPGDVVFIPSVGSQVAVEGLVKRPAIFELKKGETAAQLLKMAGGLKPQAYAKKAIVERFNNNNMKEVLSVDFSGNQINYIPRDGDRIRFNPVSFQYQNSISLIGAVARPGHYQWFEGKHISDVLTSVRGDLLPQADLGYGLLVREINIAGDIEVFQFDIAQAIVKAAEHDLELKANDKLFVFSRYQEKQAEEAALANMALTVEQQQQQIKVKQWHEYQRKEFERYVGVLKPEDPFKEEEKELSIAEISKRKAKEEEQELKPEDYAAFSRYTLLKPIIAKLKQQASVQKAMQLVEINGHVTYPGIYPLTVGSEVNELIAAAGGLLESAYTEQAEITRVVAGEGSKVEHVKFNLAQAMVGKTSENKVLRSKDSINIFSIPNWQENVKVELKGEVKFPGIYTIRRGETLTNLLERAGGFSEFAEPDAAIFTRESIRQQEQKQLAKLAEDLRRDIATKSFEKSVSSTRLSYDEMNKLLLDLANVEAVGRLVIDLPLIAEDKQNLVLQNGDTLYVPSLRDSISVIGEVNYTTSHLYKPGVSVDQYIDLSGGLKERADEDRIYIIKANGSVTIPNTGTWFAVNDSKLLEAGDTIVVPMNSDYMDNLTLWSTATQIVYQLGVALAAISSI
ncbi:MULTISPECIES: SLBB domain-containing protein [unclassified Pseudoalteromonas]|uniref:SLBB domain-containing protein n=1 Tax=unclassified Pseudoalteromonas TaxID=194690 RepID=UPI0006E59F0B|nr:MULTISPECIES: SLBB domain-containing protein [unclassified Pseudoalteromonas]KPZ66996.1 Polysialic acid transport protein KpsD precursor [Pseudoalteromonas sp. P1-26]